MKAQNEERTALDTIAAVSDYGMGWERANTRYCFDLFSRHIKGPEVLEIGPADGVMTDELMKSGLRITALEGASIFAEALQRRHKNLTVINALISEYEPDRRFDTIVLGHVLEHVVDPVDTLKRVRAWLAPEGIVLAAVPNADSLHRQAAVMMGLLPTRDTLGETDLRHGHRRVYNPQSLQEDFETAGLRIYIRGGYWLKPLSIAQMQEWSPELVAAFMRLGEDYPAIAGVIYIVAGEP